MGYQECKKSYTCPDVCILKKNNLSEKDLYTPFPIRSCGEVSDFKHLRFLYTDSNVMQADIMVR